MDRLICCSFPRTASTFLVESLRVAYPEKEIYHVFHKIEVLRKQPSMITILREPEYAVASWLTKINEKDIDGNLDWYNRFMKATINRFDEIVVLEFDDIINDVNKSIKKCQQFFNLEEPKYVDSSLVIEKIKLEHINAYSSYKNIELIEQIKQSKYYKDSFDYYQQVKSFINSRKR